MNVQTKKIIWIFSALIFLILFLQGAFLGITDDEAYYWVLSRHLAWGYAYHPPMVAWWIALFERPLSFLSGEVQPAWVRLPAAFISALSVGLAGVWFSSQGLSGGRLKSALLIFVTFAGLYGASWMMVPDLPLLLGFMLLLVGSSVGSIWMLAMGAFIALLSKFSGILAIGAAAVCVWQGFLPRIRMRLIASIFVGSLFALIPILIWNASHDWGALRYQFQERHSDFHFSGIRWLRFFIIQLVIAGPALFIFSFKFPKLKTSTARSIRIWVLFHSVFLIQPAFSDFKPHWAIVFWVALALAFAFSFGCGDFQKLGRLHLRYGIVLTSLVWSTLHYPVLPAVYQKFTGQKLDPRMDVGNDMQGWALLKYLQLDLPLVGSRYQTAAQAAFAVGSTEKVSLLPRDLKKSDEWPDLGVTEGVGPQWPKLVKPVYYITDNRYTGEAEFKNARCVRAEKITRMRGQFLAKEIQIWKCEPKH